MKNNNSFNTTKNLKIDFKGSSQLKEFYSQAGQDLFVLTALDGKKNGKFIEIGAHHPTFISNTYLLESKFGWDGILIELNKVFADNCKNGRSSRVICDDATQIDYDSIFDELGEIDYISLDIDGIHTLRALKKLPLNNHKIKVITFEHDLWQSKDGTHVRIESRKIFNNLGYERICSDVSNKNNIYEDWYVHPELVDVKNLKKLKSDGKNWDEILF